MIEEFQHRVVRDNQINFAVPVVIGECDAQSLPWFRNPDLFGNFGKVSVAIVVIDQGSDRLKDVRMAVGTVTLFALSAPDIMKVPVQVAEHHQVKQAIVIEIDPGSTG